MINISIENFNEERLSPQLQQLLGIFEIISNSDEDEYIIDFSNTTYCSCFFLGVLYSVIDTLKSNGKNIHCSPNGRIRSYLDTIKFDQKYIIDKQETVRELDLYEWKSYLPILHYPLQAVWEDGAIPSEICINALLRLIYKQVGADAGLRNDISFIISEMTDNIAQHSESSYGLIYSQYNSIGRYLDVIISDNGIGVLKSYSKNNNFSPVTDIEALRFAMEGKSSKDEMETRGFGLESSRGRIMTRSDSARFMMWSGKSIYIEMKDVKEFISLNNGVDYQGCIIFMRISC